ncbi:MAG: hypothetical protein ACJ76D_01110 [Solirubrobacterales bacterium]
MAERFFVRTLVAAALGLALCASVSAPVPVDVQGDPDLPAPAFHQVGLYRLEVALLAFYGDLLLITPAFMGLAQGRLPIEISTRGVKFGDKVDQSAEQAATAIEELEETTSRLADGLTKASLEIKRVEEGLGDRT